MIKYSDNISTDQCYSQEQIPYDNSSYRIDFHSLLEKILCKEKSKEYVWNWRKAVFITDISSVQPSFGVIDQLTNNEDEIIRSPKTEYVIDYEFIDDIPPNNKYKKYKIKVKIESIKKYIPNESDFEGLF